MNFGQTFTAPLAELRARKQEDKEGKTHENEGKEGKFEGVASTEPKSEIELASK